MSTEPMPEKYNTCAGEPVLQVWPPVSKTGGDKFRVELCGDMWATCYWATGKTREKALNNFASGFDQFVAKAMSLVQEAKEAMPACAAQNVPEEEAEEVAETAEVASSATIPEGNEEAKHDGQTDI